MKNLFLSRIQIPLVFGILIVSLFGGANYQSFLGINPSTYYECEGQMMTEAELLAYRNLSVETMQIAQAGRGLTYAELCDIPQNKLERAIYRAINPKPDHPGEAMEFRYEQLLGGRGAEEIPADVYTNAKAQIDAMIAEQELGATSAGIENTSWNWIGPGNVGGRIRALVIDPYDANTMWAGSVSGGIWKTTNGGESWQAQDDFMANLAVTSMVILPRANASDPITIYAGTGEGFWNVDAIRGGWIFKTTDGGATWTKLAIETSDPEEGVDYVNRLAISHDGSTLLAATEDGILRSVISTEDTAWTLVTSTRTLDIDFHPTNSSWAVASGSEGNLWYSTDSGATWAASSYNAPGADSFGRVEITYAPNATNTIYASINSEDDTRQDEVWKSTDGGVNYSRQNTGSSFLGGQGWYDNVIWVDPTDADTLIVGGVDLWRSTDGGVNLTKISEWWNSDSAHADHHVIVSPSDFDGTTNKKVYFGNDGGVYRTDDVYTVTSSAGWVELNNNLGITQFYGAAGNPTSGDIIGGTQDNGTLFYGYGSGDYEKSTEGWRETASGDGGFSAADSGDPDYFYGEYVYLQIYRSANAGGSATYIYDGINDAGDKDAANFIAPFILDPNDSNRLLAGGMSLWRSNNAKAEPPTWTAIKASVGVKISAIAIAPNDPKIIWVGYNNGLVYKTTNGMDASPVWTRVDNVSSGLPGGYVSRIVIDKTDNDNDIVYVTYTGFYLDNIYKTTNGGSSWADISNGSLPAMPIRSVVINPLNSNFLYLGTELGVFTSEDAGTTWDVAQDGPANVSVDELFFLDDSTLVAATHGRGLFTAQVDTSDPHPTPTPDPSYDDFDAAKDISGDLNGAISGGTMPLTVESGLDTTNATQAGDDPAMANCDIAPGPATVWYEYTPNAAATVDGEVALSINTKGSSYNTYLALWTGDRGNLTPFACNNDISTTDDDSEMAVNLDVNVTYYIEAGEYNGELSGASVGGNLMLNITGDVGTVTGTVRDGNGNPIEGATVTATGQSTLTNAAGEYTLFPVSADADTDEDTTVTASFTGLPSSSQLIDVQEDATTSGVDFVLNNPTDPDVTVTIGGTPKGTYAMTSGESSRVESYLGTNGGPVVVQSDNGAKIIASYLQFRRPGSSGAWTGLTQTMALTDKQISDVYVIPHYDYTSSIRYNSLQLANFDTIDTNIIVEIGGVVRGTFSIPVGSSKNVTFSGVVGGPVIIRSDNGAKIVATLYELQRARAGIPWTGQTTMMGLPFSDLSDTYVIPRYNYTLQDLLPYVVFASP